MRLLMACAALLVVAACKPGPAPTQGDVPAAAPAAAEPVAPAAVETEMHVKDVVVAPAAKGGATGVFLRIHNPTPNDDRLVSVTSPAAPIAEIHATVSQGDMRTMVRQDNGVALPADQYVAFAPGGYHIMLMQLPADLAVDQTIELTLTFEKAPIQIVTAKVTARDAIKALFAPDPAPGAATSEEPHIGHGPQTAGKDDHAH